MQGEEEERFKEWLNLDQADEDIGLIPNNTLNHHHSLELQDCLPFSPHGRLLDRNPLIIHQHQHQHALDPSTIFHYPSIEPSIQKSIEPSIQTSIQASIESSIVETSMHSPIPTSVSTTPTQPFHLPSHPPISTLNHHQPNHTLPNYALDPALISASIPSHHPPLGTAGTHPLDSVSPAETNNIHHPSVAASKFRLPRRSVSSHLPLKREYDVEQDDEEEEEDGILDDDHAGHAEDTYGAAFDLKMNKSNHSRSSSAILFPPSSTSQMHKRSLSHSHPLTNVPDWEDKPSAEEYKMLSSKEKRQLRNKISARNFRHRRKQHISTLEQQLAQRDQAIESLNNDLSQVRQENKELESQVQVLKQKWSDLMKKIEEMSLNPTTLPNSTATASPTTTSTGSQSGPNLLNPASPRSRSAKTNGMITLPNLHKDLGSHTRKPFNGAGGMTGGGNVGVHTTLIPEVHVDIYAEPLLARVINPIRPNGLFPGHDLSPQALIEAKMRHEKMITQGQTSCKTLRKELELHLDVGSPKFDRNHVHETRSISSSPTMDVSLGKYNQETPQEKPKDLNARLTSMVFEALKMERLNTGDQSTSDAIDPEKLKDCLDGRLVFRLVEHSPPPYRLVLGSDIKNPSTNDISDLDPSSTIDHYNPSFYTQTFENVNRLSTQLSSFQI